MNGWQILVIWFAPYFQSNVYKKNQLVNLLIFLCVFQSIFYLFFPLLFEERGIKRLLDVINFKIYKQRKKKYFL